MATTLLATALPYSLADDAPFQLTVFFTHKLAGDGMTLADYPAAADWVTTLAGCTLGLTTSLDPNTSIPLRAVSTPDAAAWHAVLPADATVVAPFPSPRLSTETWRTNPASRIERPRDRPAPRRRHRVTCLAAAVGRRSGRRWAAGDVGEPRPTGSAAPTTGRGAGP